MESHVGTNDYRIKMESKTKTYHMNMLKKFIAKEPKVDVVHTSNKDDVTIAVARVIYQDTDPELGEVDLEGCHQKEVVQDVKLGENLSEDHLEGLDPKVIQHRVKLTDDTPIRCKPYRLLHAMREELQNEVDSMLEMGVVRPSTLPYASPIVMDKKKDSSNRVCLDFRKWNKITKVDPEPMTTAKDMFHRLGGMKYLSKTDLTKGYWQKPVAPEDVYKTAFVTPDGRYEFLLMPFGMVNSGATLV